MSEVCSFEIKFSQDSSSFLQLLMIKKGLTLRVVQGLFNLNKKPPAETKSTIQKPKNKGYLAKAVLQANQNKPRLLAPSNDPNKLTVVLEMDEVLSFTFTPDEQGYLLAPRRKHDYHLWFQDYECLLNIYKRKNLQNFLSYLSEECQPVIFSTGVKSYVQLVMSLIDPTRKIKHIFTQEHCNRMVEEESDIDEYVKDLALLGRDMSRVVYIDSKPMSFWLYPQNGLCWQQFKADNTMKFQDLDDMLLELQECRKFKDIRQYLKQQYNLQQNFKQLQLL